MIYQQDLIVNLHMIEQFKRFWYGFKDRNHGFQLMQKMYKLSKIMRNYNGIELMC